MIRFLCVAIAGGWLMAAPARAAPVDDVRSVQTKWAEVFSPLEPDRMAALYSEDAVFYGSNKLLRSGRDGVRAYYAGLPKGVLIGVAFDNEKVVALTPDVISVAGTATFKRANDTDLVLRLTLVLVKRSGTWLIASHHASEQTQ